MCRHINLLRLNSSQVATIFKLIVKKHLGDLFLPLSRIFGLKHHILLTELAEYLKVTLASLYPQIGKEQDVRPIQTIFTITFQGGRQIQSWLIGQDKVSTLGLLKILLVLYFDDAFVHYFGGWGTC